MRKSGNPPPDPKFTFRGNLSTVTALCFNENAKELISGSESGEIIIWSLLVIFSLFYVLITVVGTVFSKLINVIEKLYLGFDLYKKNFNDNHIFDTAIVLIYSNLVITFDTCFHFCRI